MFDAKLMHRYLPLVARKVRASADDYKAKPADGFLLIIEDDGPGCPDADLERIAERGVCHDKARAGHRLGLAIVRNIVSSYGSELSLGRSSPLDGMLVSVSTPIDGGFGRRAPVRNKLVSTF